MSVARKGAQRLNMAISSVCLAGAFIVQDDESWSKFGRYINGLPGKSNIGDNERKAMDNAVWIVDNMRRGICVAYGLDPGTPYPRHFE